MTILLFLIVLAILIFVHELGHFLVARACGIRVDAFAIGFGLGYVFYIGKFADPVKFVNYVFEKRPEVKILLAGCRLQNEIYQVFDTPEYNERVYVLKEPCELKVLPPPPPPWNPRASATGVRNNPKPINREKYFIFMRAPC